MLRDRFLSDGPLTPTRPTRTRVHGSHTHVLSRRGFLQGAAGVTAVGAMAGSGLFRATAAEAAGPPGIGLAEPIPTTVEFFPGVASHVQAPPSLFGPDSDPATVYNFEGACGIAFISGLCERHNRKTGETRTLPFLFNDMRFMKGAFRGRDGHVRGATFALV
ncbi:MAG: hypothetical protein QOJ66_2408 [Ilumatobacteraceae bacterium]